MNEHGSHRSSQLFVCVQETLHSPSFAFPQGHLGWAWGMGGQQHSSPLSMLPFSQLFSEAG